MSPNVYYYYYHSFSTTLLQLYYVCLHLSFICKAQSISNAAHAPWASSPPLAARLRASRTLCSRTLGLLANCQHQFCPADLSCCCCLQGHPSVCLLLSASFWMIALSLSTREGAFHPRPRPPACRISSPLEVRTSGGLKLTLFRRALSLGSRSPLATTLGVTT